jgi:hypothetical protein
MTRYSVLLAYPPESFKCETYFEHVEAANPKCAVDAARKLAARFNHGIFEPEDFEPLLCIEGHHDNLL